MVVTCTSPRGAAHVAMTSNLVMSLGRLEKRPSTVRAQSIVAAHTHTRFPHLQEWLRATKLVDTYMCLTMSRQDAAATAHPGSGGSANRSPSRSRRSPSRRSPVHQASARRTLCSAAPSACTSRTSTTECLSRVLEGLKHPGSSWWLPAWPAREALGAAPCGQRGLGHAPGGGRFLWIFRTSVV